VNARRFFIFFLFCLNKWAGNTMPVRRCGRNTCLFALLV
jgi:hypothetical protein